MEIRKNKYCFRVLIFAVALVLIISVVKYRGGEINYVNSDATWHVLYTMKCYDETPVKTHKFLPIVSMGKESDKWISWGACIPDKSGNYYYTSFSPAGYIMPYLFIKFFNLNFDEMSIYIFNTLLFLISVILLSLLLMEFFKNSENVFMIAICGISIYVLNPELLHGMGLVYWHQSVMQVTLLIQFYSYYIYKRDASKSAYAVFLIMCFANPYIEWTGYVANLGFAIFELVSNWKKNPIHALFYAEQIVLFTVLSFGFFCFHYLLNVSPRDFLVALRNRFFARNFTTATELSLLLKGYVGSFKFLWLLLVFILVWGLALLFVKKANCADKKSVHKLLPSAGIGGGGVLIFPVFENFIMKQHAVSYTYDRMKLIFPLCFVLCGLICFVMQHTRFKKIVVGVVLIFSCLNFSSYSTDEFYVWKTDYRGKNLMIAKYMENYKDGCVYGYSYSVRGYINMVFDSGIYEWIDLPAIKNIAIKKNKRYSALIYKHDNPKARWNMYDIKGVLVFDSETQKTTNIFYDENAGKILENVCTTAAITTNKNWINGVSVSGETVLFYFSENLLEEIKKAEILSCDGIEFQILNFNYDGQWIRVTVDKDANCCRFPNEIKFLEEK